MADIRIVPAQGAINVTGSANFKGDGGSSVLFVTGSGQIGAGTTAPESELHVVGSGTRFLTLDRTGTRSYDLGINSSGTLLVTDNTGTTDRISLSHSGSVGIGTTGPISLLHLRGSEPAIRIVDTDDSSTSIIGSTSGYTFIRPFSRDFRVINDAGTGLLTVKTGGSIGIGTTGPTKTLQVVGEVRFSSYGAGTVSGTAARTLAVDSSGNVIEVANSSLAGSGTANRVAYWTDSNTIAADADFFFDGTNVGIGTTAPIGKLQIGGTSGNLLTVGTLTNDWVGDVAIGITNGNGVIISKVNAANDTNRVLVFLRDDTNGASVFGYTPTGGGANVGFQIRANASSFFNGGSVGIGTTSPGARLHVEGGNTIFNNGSADTILAIETDAAGLYDPVFQMGSGQNSIGTEGFEIWYANNVGDVHLSTTYNNAAASIRFHTATGASKSTSNERMIITGDGNVGIGTTSPTVKFQVNGRGDFTDTLTISKGANDTVQLGSSVYLVGGSGASYTQLQQGVGRFIIFGFNGSSWLERFTIDNTSGNVGIGNASPNQKLVVAGNIAVSASNTEGAIWLGEGQDVGLFRNNTYDLVLSQQASSGNPLYLAGAGDVVVSIDSNNNSTSNKFIVGSNAVKASNELFSVNESGNTYVSNDLNVDGKITAREFHTTFVSASIIYQSGSTQFGNSSDDTHVFTGCIGVGTASPSYTLDVQSNLSSEPYAQARFLNTNSSGTEYGGILVNGTNQAHIRFLTGTSTWGGSGAKQWQIRSGIGANVDALSIYSWTAGTDVIYFNSSGNVGVGTTAPATKLQVNGTFASNALWTDSGAVSYWGSYSTAYGGLTWDTGYATVFAAGGNKLHLASNGSSPDMTIGTDGNVGIGSTSPAYPLDVNGNVRAGRIVTTGLYGPSTSGNIPIWQYDAGNPEYGIVYAEGSPDTLRIDVSGNALTGTPDFLVGGDYAQINGNTVWHAGNDGTGSGLDADLLDGQHGSYYTNATNIDSGTLSNSRLPSAISVTSVTASFKGNLDGNATTATTATNVAWTGVTAGERTNYTLGFEPADNTSSYAGFYFSAPGGSENGGYFLIRGGADNDVYTQNGITLVADAGWLTLAQRTASDKGIRFMTGTSSTTRMSIFTNGTIGIGTSDALSNMLLVAGSHPSGYSILGIRPGVDQVATLGFYNTSNVRKGILYTTANFFSLESDNLPIALQPGTANVGIGTTGPSNKLQVVGGVTATSFTGSFLGNVDGNITGTAASETLQTVTTRGSATTTGMTIAGSVGIGTTAPLNLLHVSQASANTIFRLGNNASYDQFIYFNGGNDWSLGMDYSNSNAFVLSNASSIGTNDRVVVTTAGNVGIGSTAPRASLDVAGGITIRNTRVSTAEKYPLGHYTPGETVFEIDPTWTEAQLQDYFNSTGVTWTADSTSPGGYAIQIDGEVNVGGEYNTGFPYIPVDSSQDDWFYMECWIRNEAGSVNQHYMGGIDYNESFVSLGGNPGSFTYNVMSNYNPGTSWTRVFGYWNGFGNSSGGAGTGNINNWESGTKYFTPQALFNYSNSSGTRRSYISGWKCVRVRATGNRYYSDNVLVSGNVGIGTTAPGVKLQVVGANTVEGQLYVGNTDVTYSAGINFTTSGANRGFVGWRHTNSGAPFNLTGIHLFNTDNSNIVFGTNNLVRAVIDTNGNVGIGTTSPTAKLHVSGGDAVLRNAFIGEVPTYGAENAQFSHISRATAGEYSFLSANDGETFINSKTGTNIRFRVNNSDKVIITSAGNVGINTTSPSTNLHVQGSNLMATFRNSSTSANQYTQLEFIAGSRDAYIWLGNQATTEWAGDGGLNIYTGTGNMDFWTAATQKMRLTSDGNLLVGATNADVGGSVKGAIIRQDGSIVAARNIATPFHYQSPISADRMNTMGDGIMYSMWRQGIFQAGIGATNAAAMTFFTGDNSSATEHMRIISSGNIGIGTTGPLVKLDVRGTAIITNPAGSSYDENLRLPQATSGYAALTLGGSIAASGTSASQWTLVKYPTTDLFTIRNNSSDHFAITTSGNVGIGTTAPQKALEVIVGTNDVASVGVAGLGIGNFAGIHFGYRESNLFYRKSAIVFERTDLTSNNAQGKVHILNGPQAGSGNATLADARLTISENGNVGIGLTSPSARLEIASAAGANDEKLQRWTYYAPTPTDYYLDLKQTVTSSVVRYNFSMVNSGTAYNDVLVLDRGNVGIGTTNPAYKLDVSGTIRATGDVIAYSDARVKENIVTLENSLELVQKLRGVSYNKIGESEKKVGVIAQEVLEVLPEVVQQDQDGRYSVAYGNITAVLIEAIKQQQSQINELKQEIKQLKG